MTPPVRVVVVGDLMTDVVVRVRDRGPLAERSDTAARIATHGGGSAANTAAWLAVAGAPVSLVARRGDDAYGDAAERLLAAGGVRPRLAVDPVRPTGTCVVLVDPEGERTMLPDRSANLALAPDDLPADEFVPGHHLHLSGYVLLDAGSRPAGLAALALARAAGMTVSVDPSSAAPLRRAGAAAFLDWTRDVWACLPNTDEAAVLTGRRDAAGAARALAADYGEVVVTGGVAGAVWSDGSTTVAAPAEPARVADTTGAGDAFTAGYLAARLLAERPPGEALGAGAALAARAVTRPGGRP